MVRDIASSNSRVDYKENATSMKVQ